MDCAKSDSQRQYRRQKRPVARGGESGQLRRYGLAYPALQADEIPENVSDDGPSGSFNVWLCGTCAPETRTCLAVLMFVAMMQVRIMGMGVVQRLMPVPMRMWLRHDALMRMLVVLIMHVAVLVFQRAMLVFVHMAFREMQPEPQAHQETSKRKLQR